MLYARGWCAPALIGLMCATSVVSATIVAERLTGANIPNKMVGLGLRGNQRNCSIWVPPEFEAAARSVLAETSVSEDELTTEALSYPKPDDA